MAVSSIPSKSQAPTTTLDLATTTNPPSFTGPWEDAAEREVENLLAALTAGAFEAAGWVGENEGLAFPDQRPDETMAGYWERQCGNSRCAGPYSIAASRIVPDPRVGANETVDVVVRHGPSKEESVLRVGWHEGKRIVSGLPPLVESSGGPSLIESLFGDEQPTSVVVERYHAFEVWEEARTWSATSPVSLAQREIAVEPDGLIFDSEGAFAGLLESGGMRIDVRGDAEGNLVAATNAAGVSLIGDDYPGRLRLSADGSVLAYADHRDSFSPPWSNVLVARDTTTGAELGRWLFDETITCIEATADWLLVCLEDNLEELVSGEWVHDSLISIRLGNGFLNEVESHAYVHLP